MATLLPEPDSPTMPTISFCPTSKESPSTARSTPWRVATETLRSRTRRSGVRSMFVSGKTHSRIQVGVEHVHDRVREHHEESTVHHATHRSEEHTSELQSLTHPRWRLL